MHPSTHGPDHERTGKASDRGSPGALAGKRLHFVGVGGCGMSGLARIARQEGAVASGSDRSGSPATTALMAEGVDVSLNQSGDALPQGLDTLVVSAAIPPDHGEVQAAQSQGVEVVKYAQMLGRLMGGRRGVAIAGTHGKSTTTSLLCHILLACGIDPSFIVGAHCEQIGGGARVGASDLLLAEACEYDRSFHHLRPTHAAVLNLEADHLDYYANLEEIVESFAQFARLIPGHGSLLMHHESPHRLAVTAGLDAQVQTIGFSPQADWRVECLASGGWDLGGGRISDRRGVRLYHAGKPVAAWRSPMPGEHMDYNAAVAAVLAHRFGADWLDIADAVEGFRGLDRRMQHVGYADAERSVSVIDDYGHHPTEVDTTLRALRLHYQPERLICVFQPHQHSRTRFLLDQFAVSFAAADVVLVPEIYFVRDSEQDRHSVTATDLVNRLRASGVHAAHVDPLEALGDHLSAMVRPGDLVVTMGAGDVWTVARTLVDRAGGAQASQVA
ncbi:MAG: UDP-N-acetylmuramate--L-alanine ligase [Planctomycetota bacterium]